MPNYEFFMQGLTTKEKESLQTANIGTFEEGIYKSTNGELIGGARVQPFKDEKALIGYELLPGYNNEEIANRVLGTLIDYYGTLYESTYESFIIAVDRYNKDDTQKMENSDWKLDVSLSEEWSNELNTNKAIYAHSNPHYVSENDLPNKMAQS